MKLLTKITYAEKHYHELTDETHRKIVLDLAIRLQPLEGEILSEVGLISYSKEGNLYTIGYPQILIDKMHNLIHQV